MNERTANILEAAVESFIDVGEPISSGWLYDHYDFGIKPAMIRLELEDLSDKGFLEQPYHSSGRIPKDKGYEFYAERVLESDDRGKRGHFDKFRELFEKRAWPSFVEEISSELGLLSIADDLGERVLYKEGLEDLIEHLEWATRDEVRSVIRDFTEIDGKLNQISKKIKDSPQVFVGRKSPVTRSRNLSVVAGSYSLDGNRVMLLAIGPKRMDYKKTLKIFKNLNE